jgi:5-hydroxyisourate hydrolase
MAVVSSHTLNSLDGTHAGGIKVTLTQIGADTPLFATQMDAGGRLSEVIDFAGVDTDAIYELVFETAPYWKERGTAQSIPEIVLRFKMLDPAGKYHMPIILSPHGYSMWSAG